MIPNWYISLARTNLAPQNPLTWNEAFDVIEGLVRAIIRVPTDNRLKWLDNSLLNLRFFSSWLTENKLFPRLQNTVLKISLTAGVTILRLPSLYNNSFWIKEIGRPWVSPAHPLAVMKARLLSWAYRTYTIAQGCPLQRFLHVPQEAAGGSKREGSKLVLSGKAPLSFFPATFDSCLKLSHREEWNFILFVIKKSFRFRFVCLRYVLSIFFLFLFLIPGKNNDGIKPAP